MTICIMEYDNVTPLGEPIEPVQRVRAGLAADVAHTLGFNTRYVRMTTTAACYFLVSRDGAAATSAHQPLAAGDVAQFPISSAASGVGAAVYATAA